MERTLKALWILALLYAPEAILAAQCVRLKKTVLLEFIVKQQLLPNRGASKKKKEKEIFWLIPKDKNNNVYLEKRPEKGIWGGLWSFIECDEEEELEKIYKSKFSPNTSSIKKYKEIGIALAIMTLRHMCL